MNKYFILGFFLTLFSQIQAQEPNDCINAITVCGSGTFSSNASGIGAIQEVSGCGGFEHNSLWLEINIVQAGTLGFDLIPDDPSLLVDYDFWVYGPNRLCSNLGSPIRCATTNPDAAGLTNNHTGINGSTTLTQTGPGSNGNGYVYWLTVAVGQTYYIVIDRPHGDGGFEIQWTGTATNGTGAFPTPPTANAINDVIQCSSTPNISVFDLNALRSSINSIPTNTIEFYESLADATDGINPLPNIYANTSNPQQIYAKVKSGVTDCYSLVDFNLIVSPIPDALVAATPTSICEGENVVFTITGTPNATVHYTLDGGTTTLDVILDATGTATISLNPTSDTTIDLIDIQILSASNTVVCSQMLTVSETVTVTPNVSPTFTQVAPICVGDALTALPTTSINGVTGSWSPALNNTTTTTYTFTPNTGQCATTQTMEIIVNPIITPTFTQVAPICSGDALSALPTTSNNGVSGTWSPALDNTTTTTYTFTPNTGQCGIVVTMEIIVNPIITPTFTQVAPICSGDALSALPTTSNNGVTGSWSPAINNTTTTTYTFTPSSGLCATVETMVIVVNPIITPTFTQVAPICNGEPLAPLPTTSNNGVSGTWSPALNNTATTTYTFTPTTGLCASTQTMVIVVNPSTTPTFTQVSPICNGDALAPLPTTSNNGITGSWSPALNNTTTTTYTFTPNIGQCAATQTMTITVNPIITPTFIQVSPICSGDALSALPTTSNNGVTGSWSPAINNTTTTTYTFTPNVGQCATVETMVIVVNPIITPTFTQVAPICNGESLAPLPTTSINGVTGSWSPTLNNTTTTTYTFTPSSGLCALPQTMTIAVNPMPTISLNSLTGCSTTGDGYYAFNLFAEIPAILGSSQNSSNYSVIFYEDPATTILISANPYTNSIAYNQTIYVVISNNNTSCSNTFSFNLIVEDAATANMPNPVIECDYDGTNDGFYPFDLTSLNPEVLNGQDPNTYQVSYYWNALDAQDGFNPIADPSAFINTTAYNQTIYIRVTNVNIPDVCFATTSFDYTVSPILKPVITSVDGLNTICVDFETGILQNQITLVSDLQNPNYIYTWYLNNVEIVGANQGSYVINSNAPGLYTLSITENSSVANCTSEISEPFEVIQSGQAVFVSVTQSGTFDPNPSIIVTVDGYGEYWYQLDDGPILNNGGVFTNVSGGLHTVYVYDRKTENPSCGFITIEDIQIIDYPKFVTPNDDGYNDTWNIFDLKNQPNAQINIFDRYGKTLASIKPSGPGWDGTYNGNMLPATDYWFVLSYEESGQQKQFRAHFALKR
jgi:gliding motility-associated-like protein